MQSTADSASEDNTSQLTPFLFKMIKQIVLLAVTSLAALVFWLVNKIFHLISIIPFTKSLNRLLGALFGFLEGSLVLGLSLYFISRFTISDWFAEVLLASKVAYWLIKMAAILTPLLPVLLRQLQSVI